MSRRSDYCEVDHSRKKLWSGWGILLLSSSLLGTWPHVANGSIANGPSRSRLRRTWLRNTPSSPVGGTFGGQETCDEFLKFQVSIARSHPSLAE